MKEIFIKNLQNDNERLREKCEQLLRRCAKFESDHNALAQHGLRNNVPGSVSDDTLEGSVLSFGWYSHGHKHRRTYKFAKYLGKLADKNKKKIIVQFVNRENYKKVVSNKKKFGKLITESTILAAVQKYLPVRIQRP